MPTLTNSAENPVPLRAKLFKQRQASAILLKPLARLTGKEIIPSQARHQELIDGLWQGDPLMDQVVEWLCEKDSKQRKAMFEQALQQGIDHLTDAPPVLVELFALIDQQPDWLDINQLDVARQFMQSVGLNANYILKDMALMGGYLLSGFNQALVLTGALDKNASQRLAETSKWWMDCTEKNGLARFNTGFKSTIHVRMIHALVRRNLQRKQDWRSEQWGLPICQIDMAATNLAFCSLFLLGLRAIGIFPAPHEASAVMHFWKYLGWLMGVDERWLVDSELDGHILLYHTMLTQSPPDWTSKALGYALSQEPLTKQYDSWQAVKRYWDYHKRLSISQYFLGRKKMQQLGVEKRILPWYPLLLIPANLLTYHPQRHLPLLQKLQQQRGRQAQLEHQRQFGKKGHKIIQPDQQHPAYIAS
ncbi:oxygenase MpaB family protein [Alkanindiges sp. WGS2144]|uniref:oxygenase MpaB family protein n=1 Tax=Alkanindiges sp. WGS2144 TaxID=3366808 RepID=UPI003751F48E